MFSINEKLPKMSKPVGIVVSIVMVVLGVLLFVLPKMLIALMYIASTALVIYGIYEIVKYVAQSKETKQGWSLAMGILLTMCGLIFFFSSPTSEALTYSFLFAMLAFLFGIRQLITTTEIKKTGGKTGFIIFTGILCILVGVFFCFAPILMEFALDYILGIALILVGIAVFANSISASRKKSVDVIQDESCEGSTQVTKETISDANGDTIVFEQTNENVDSKSQETDEGSNLNEQK